VGREKFLKCDFFNYIKTKNHKNGKVRKQNKTTEALKVLLPLSFSYICEVGFSAMVGMKTKFRNKLQLSNSLRLKIARNDVDVNAVINSNRKQAHQSHTPHYEK
jgi:hypothetical protein